MYNPTEKRNESLVRASRRNSGSWTALLGTHVTHATAPNSDISFEHFPTMRVNLHKGTAEETDTDHERPAGDGTNAEDGVANGNVQAVLGEPAVGGVHGALVGGHFLKVLLGVDLVELIWGYGGGVHVDDVERSRQALLALGLGLGHLEVEDGGGAGRPGRAKNAIVLAVQQTEVRGGRIGGEKEDGFLDCDGQMLKGIDVRLRLVLH